jgi:broad specificity polyphosphatase/5'/3'-nucleotidase SurE
MEFAHTAEGTDVEALWDPAVTVTPLSFDLTDHARMQSWRERLS